MTSDEILELYKQKIAISRLQQAVNFALKLKAWCQFISETMLYEAVLEETDYYSREFDFLTPYKAVLKGGRN